MNSRQHQPFPTFASREAAAAHAVQTGDGYFQICHWLEGQPNLAQMAMSVSAAGGAPCLCASSAGVLACGLWRRLAASTSTNEKDHAPERRANPRAKTPALMAKGMDGFIRLNPSKSDHRTFFYE